MKTLISMTLLLPLFAFSDARQAYGLIKNGQLVEAKTMLLEQIGQYEGYKKADSQTTLALVFEKLNDVESAEQMHNAALNTAIDWYKDEPYLTKRYAANLGSFYIKQEKFEQAIFVIERSIKNIEAHFGKGHIEASGHFDALVKIYLLSDQKLKAVTLKEKTFNNNLKYINHPFNSYLSMATFFSDLNDWQQAEKYYTGASQLPKNKNEKTNCLNAKQYYLKLSFSLFKQEKDNKAKLWLDKYSNLDCLHIKDDIELAAFSSMVLSNLDGQKANIQKNIAKEKWQTFVENCGCNVDGALKNMTYYSMLN